MDKNFREYCRQHNKLNITYLSEKFAQPKRTICEWLVELWGMFENPHMVGDMLVTNYHRQSWYYEVCDSKYDRGNYVPEDALQDHWLSNQRYDQHISVFAHDRKWASNADQSQSVSCSGTQIKCGLFWIELDRKDYQKRANFQKAVKDGISLRNRILSECPKAQLWVFTSGNNSTHIAINGSLFGSPILSQNDSRLFKHLAQLLTEGLRFGFEGNPRHMGEDRLRELLQQCYSEVSITDNPESEHQFKWDSQIAESALENCDTNIYHTNGLIRQPWSWHEKGRNRKALIDLNGEFNYKPRRLEVKNQRPHLLWLYLKAWERLKDSNKQYNKKLAKKYDSSYILDEYEDVFPDIKRMEPNNKGWVEDLYNPFYEDTNPSVGVNVNTGIMKDFGSERHSYTFEQFLIKKQEL